MTNSLLSAYELYGQPLLAWLITLTLVLFLVAKLPYIVRLLRLSKYMNDALVDQVRSMMLALALLALVAVPAGFMVAASISALVIRVLMGV